MIPGRTKVRPVSFLVQLARHLTNATNGHAIRVAVVVGRPICRSGDQLSLKILSEAK